MTIYFKDAEKELQDLGLDLGHRWLNKQTLDIRIKKLRPIILNKELWQKKKKELLMIKNNYVTVVDIGKELREKTFGCIVYDSNITKFQDIISKKINISDIDLNGQEWIIRLKNNKYIHKKVAEKFIDVILDTKVVYIRGDDKYYKDIKDLTLDEIKNDYYLYKDLGNHFAELNEKIIGKRFVIDNLERYKLNVIGFIGYGFYYIPKKEFDEKFEDAKTFVNKETLKAEVEHLTDKKIDSEFLEARKIRVYRDSDNDRNSLFVRGITIKKVDLEKLKASLIDENNKNSAQNLYELWQINIKNKGLDLNKNVDILNEFDKYVIAKSNENIGKNSIFGRLNEKANCYGNIYKILSEWVNGYTIDYNGKGWKNFDITNQKSIDGAIKRLAANEIIQRGLSQFATTPQKILKAFLNKYYKFRKGELKVLSIVEETNLKIVEPENFNRAGYIEIFMKLIDFLNDEQRYKVLVKERTITGSLLYVFINYLFAWRKADIEDLFPRPKLELIDIKYSDAELFLKDLEDGNLDFNELKGGLICNNIEQRIVSQTAQKNNEKLDNYIPKDIYKELGLLLSIAEANFKYMLKYDKRKHISRTKLISITSMMESEIIKAFNFINIDMNQLLGTRYGNLKATKMFGGFTDDICKELKESVLLEFMKYRAHKGKEGIGKIPSQTGNKFYLDDEKLNVEKFNLSVKGTMGSIKDYFIGLTNPEYKANNDSETEIALFKQVKATNADIEEFLEVLNNKNKDLKLLFQQIGKDNNSINKYIKTFLYGDAYSKHVGVKCAYRAYLNSQLDIDFQKDDLVLFNRDRSISCPFNGQRDTCVGCSYIVASKTFIWDYKTILDGFFEEFYGAEDWLKKIYISVFNTIHIPIVSFMVEEYGKEVAYGILGVDRYEKWGSEVERINGNIASN